MRLLIEETGRGESSQVVLRSRLRAVSRRMGFSGIARERIELVCNELLTNQNKHAHGQGMMQAWETRYPCMALNLFAIDYGPGISNPEQASQDGFTTANTLGKGLGAIRRLSDECEFFSVPQEFVHEVDWHGFAAWVRFYPQAPNQQSAWQVGQLLRSYHDLPYNGDEIILHELDGRLRWLHLDALGHGKDAAAILHTIGLPLEHDKPLIDIMGKVGKRLQKSRGAVGVIGEYTPMAEQVEVAGIGDMMACLVCNGERRVLEIAPGILGHEHRSMKNNILHFPQHALMMTASDGLRRNWSLRSFPGLWRLHPQLIAFFLGQLKGRANDDKSVLLIRPSPT